MLQPLVTVLKKNAHLFHPVVPLSKPQERLVALDFSESNTQLTQELLENIDLLEAWVQGQVKSHDAAFGIGGYAELRKVYDRSSLFSDPEGGEPRRLHLGVDIWGPAGTQVFAPLGGMVHSFAFNNRKGDYGATIVLLHQLDGIPFYTLYGHLRVRDLSITEGQYVNRGEVFAHFGVPAENGHWPPHLHFQIIIDMQELKGDYPGVCRFSERAAYLSNCPDPELILQLQSFVVS